MALVKKLKLEMSGWKGLIKSLHGVPGIAESVCR